MSLPPGSRTRIQCDGPLLFVGAQNLTTCRDNVLLEINDGDLRLWCDALNLLLAESPPA